MAREKVTRQGKLSTYIGLILNADLIILSLLLFSICAGHFFVYYERTAYLRVFGRPYVFLHLLVSIFSLYPIIKYHVLMLVHILCIESKEKNKKDTSKDDDVIVLELQDMSNSSASRESSQSKEMNQEKSSSIGKNCPLLLYMYKLFLEFYVVDGKYYIHQLYLCKFYELAYQFYSIVYIYTCSFPTVFNVIFAGILGTDSLINGILTWRLVNTTVARDRLLIWHTIADFAYLCIPNFLLYYGYHIPLSVETSIILTVPTTLFILLRILEVMNNFIRIDLIRIKQLKKDCATESNSDANERSMKRRFSIFRASLAEPLLLVEKKQFHHFNGIFRSFAIAILLMVSGFMFSVALAQSLQVIGNKTFFEECIKIYDSEEMNVNLYKHCVSEAAFCQNLFQPACDCLHVSLSDYNHTRLPSNSKYMKSLRILKVTDGRLLRLPESFGFNHQLLVKLHIENNFIEKLPESICSLKNLLYLYLPQNLLEELPHCIGELESMVRLVAFRNNIKLLPESIGRLENNLLHILICK